MSKLFNTLEQIRQNEAAQASSRKAVSGKIPATGRKRQKSLLIAIVIVLIGAGLYLSWPTLTTLVLRWQEGRIAGKHAGNQSAVVSPQTDPNSPPGQAPVANEIPPSSQEKTSEPVAQTAAASVAQTKTSSSQSGAADQDFIALNNKGAALVSQQKYWEGIYLLKQAHEKQPNRIEPLINMGVALAELGLYSPASRYFKLARQIDAQNPKLLANMALLQSANLFESRE